MCSLFEGPNDTNMIEKEVHSFLNQIISPISLNHLHDRFCVGMFKISQTISLVITPATLVAARSCTTLPEQD